MIGIIGHNAASLESLSWEIGELNWHYNITVFEVNGVYIMIFHT